MMQAQTDTGYISTPRGTSSSDVAVLLSMTALAGAIGTGLVLHGGWPLVSAALVAGLAWIALVPLHMMARKSKPTVSMAEAQRATASPSLAPLATTSERRQPEPPTVGADREGARLPPRVPPKLPPQYADAIADAVAAQSDEKDAAAAEQADHEVEAPPANKPKFRPLPSTSPQIDDIIKRLASDISAGRTMPDHAPSPDADIAHVSAATSRPDRTEAFPVRAEDFFASPPPLPGNLADAADAEPATTPLATPASSRIAAIADALMTENIEVFLEPIQGLEDTTARHYEVSARLRLSDGSSLGHDEYTAAARGTGLLPLIDAVKVSHTKRVALQLIERGRTGSFFSQIAGETLASDQFGDDVTAITRRDRDVTARLVLSFPQSDVRGFTPAQWRSLDDLRDLGFQFAVEHITDMDMDFEALGRRGFTFAKLDADVFANGLPAPDGLIPPADTCQHLARAGLTLIVQAISDERQLMEILGFGVLFGQGEMFGGARPVRAHVLRDTAPTYEGVSGTA